MTDLELAAYIDRGLSPGDRDRIENHIAFCDACRSAVVAGRELGRLQRRGVMLRRAAITTVAAAAIVLTVTTFAPDSVRQEQMRDEGAGATLTVHGPIGEAARTGLRFVWAAEASALSYRLTLSGANGAAVWTHSGRDTIAMLPDSVRLTPGQRYFWTVDAILASGSSRSTGMREFVISP